MGSGFRLKEVEYLKESEWVKEGKKKGGRGKGRKGWVGKWRKGFRNRLKE